MDGHRNLDGHADSALTADTRPISIAAARALPLARLQTDRGVRLGGIRTKLKAESEKWKVERETVFTFCFPLLAASTFGLWLDCRSSLQQV